MGLNVMDCRFIPGIALETPRIDVRSPVDPIHWFLDGKKTRVYPTILRMRQPNFRFKGLS